MDVNSHLTYNNRRNNEGLLVSENMNALDLDRVKNLNHTNTYSAGISFAGLLASRNLFLMDYRDRLHLSALLFDEMIQTYPVDTPRVWIMFGKI